MPPRLGGDMPTITDRGFEDDDNFSSELIKAGIDEMAIHANGGMRPEEVASEPVPIERSIGGLTLGVYEPTGEQGITAVNYRNSAVPIKTGRLLVRKQMPLFIRGDASPSSGDGITKKQIFGQSQ
jgi:hypothetical protein